MTESQKLSMLQSMTGEGDMDILLAYLSFAGAAVLNRCYPFDKEKKEVPGKYAGRQVEIAAYLLNKRGAEGQTSHGENGISRGYESGSIPESMLSDVLPFVGIF